MGVACWHTARLPDLLCALPVALRVALVRWRQKYPERRHQTRNFILAGLATKESKGETLEAVGRSRTGFANLLRRTVAWEPESHRQSRQAPGAR